MADKPTAGQFPSITFGGTNQSTYTSSRSILNHTSLTSSSPPRIMSNSENRLPPLESLLRNEPLNKPAEKPFNVSTMIISPPSIPMDNFHQNPVVATVGIPKDSGHTQSSKPLLSPPISPAVDVVDLNAAQSTPTSATETDPILFPSSGQLSAASPPSLFGNDAANDRQRAIERHVAKRDDTLFKIVAPPKQQEYDLMLTFQVNIMRHFQKNPQQWLQRCKQQLKADAQAREKYRNRSRFQPIQPAKPNMIRVSRPVKPEATVAKPSALRPIRSKNSVQKPARQSGSPEPKRAPSSREDKDFNAVPDFCPPQSSLDQRSWDLDKIDWKGTPVDLSTDPHAHLLHPEELQLASRLRLDCATYLTNKRRLFVKRLWAARKPKDFRKTDAQQACKIDVNKASRLWTAYDMAGWLQVKYMEPYMDVELPEE